MIKFWHLTETCVSSQRNAYFWERKKKLKTRKKPSAKKNAAQPLQSKTQQKQKSAFRPREIDKIKRNVMKKIQKSSFLPTTFAKSSRIRVQIQKNSRACVVPLLCTFQIYQNRNSFLNSSLRTLNRQSCIKQVIFRGQQQQKMV